MNTQDIQNTHHRITLDLEEAISSTYSVRKASGKDAKYSSIEMAIPKGAIEIEARLHGMGIDQFLEEFCAEVFWGSFSGMFVTFIPKES